MSELVSTRYKRFHEDISRHVDQMVALLEKIGSMGATFSEDLAFGILVASIEVPELQPVAAAIKTLAEKDISWGDVTSRLIE